MVFGMLEGAIRACFLETPSAADLSPSALADPGSACCVSRCFMMFISRVQCVGCLVIASGLLTTPLLASGTALLALFVPSTAGAFPRKCGASIILWSYDFALPPMPCVIQDRDSFKESRRWSRCCWRATDRE